MTENTEISFTDNLIVIVSVVGQSKTHAMAIGLFRPLEKMGVIGVRVVLFNQVLKINLLLQVKNFPIVGTGWTRLGIDLVGDPQHHILHQAVDGFFQMRELVSRRKQWVIPLQPIH